ncbi:MAG: hypothetical protein GY937_22790 [bacterium]|nr:hypothetical protein [bacterium]
MTAERCALVSVSDKRGIVDFARGLSEHGFEILSTGGTARALRDEAIHVRDVSDCTGSPEIMGGRVKTLHPRVHGGILMRNNGQDPFQLEQIGGAPIDLVAVNLYPFRETVARGASRDDAIETIDIGGPTMVRSAAKNHSRVTVVVDPDDYDDVLTSLGAGGPDLSLRIQLATKAFSHTAAYDDAIATYLGGKQRSHESKS